MPPTELQDLKCPMSWISHGGVWRQINPVIIQEKYNDKLKQKMFLIICSHLVPTYEHEPNHDNVFSLSVMEIL